MVFTAAATERRESREARTHSSSSLTPTTLAWIQPPSPATFRLRKIDLWATEAKQGTTRLPELEKRCLRYERSYDCRLGYLRIYGPTS